MIVTARQLDDLHRQNGRNGHVTLPYRARLSPLANDWVRAKRVSIGYSDVPVPQAGANGTITKSPLAASRIAPATDAASPSLLPFLWWCDGPCGPAKAALVAQERESALHPLDLPADARQVVAVIKTLAAEVKNDRAVGGVLLVQNAAAALVFANRCPSLRAIVGTCLEAVEQGIRQVGANVLVVEYPYKTLQQMKNLLGRFTRGRRELSDEVKKQLGEMTSCG